MKSSVLIILLFSTRILFSQFYPVNETTIDISFLNKKLKEKTVAPFAISNLITVREFNEYLVAVQNDSTAVFFNSQLPTSQNFPKELLQIILADSTLQNKPMPGVSWIVARNYCNWLNNRLSTKNKEVEYDLPSLSELIAFNKLYGKLNNSELESWTLNSYDESMLEYSTTIDYSYNAYDSDPPSMKRKVIFGGSYHMAYNPVGSYRKLQYEYQDSSSRFVGFRIVRRFKSEINNSMILGDLTVKYQLKNDQFNGIYEEKFPNGTLKVLGVFLNGNRNGIWSIWDENGELKIQRNYINNKSCDFLFPHTNNPYKAIYNSFPAYKLQRNSDNYYPYLSIEERAVVYSQRIWRELSKNNQNEFFNQLDGKQFIKLLFENKIKWYYYGKYGDLKHEIAADSIPDLQLMADSMDFSRLEIVEVDFFNMDNLLSETRQIGISFYKNEDDDKPSYTIYYPAVRKILANFNFENSELKEIKNLDDFFFFHAYRGNILSYSYNSSPSDRGSLNEFSIELEKFVKEHELWFMYGR